MIRIDFTQLAEVNTPTPNPSPQGGGGPDYRSVVPTLHGLMPSRAAAKSPSPLRGGVRGGGTSLPHCLVGKDTRFFRLTLALISILLTFTTQSFAANTTVQAAIDGFVRPAYARFATATKTQRSAIDQLCASPSEAPLEAARTAFRQGVIAWSEVETIRFGPVTEQNHLERILFWPDRKSIGLKQVQAALVDEDKTATDPKTLAGKSVAMQGFGSLEFVLFGTGSDELTSNAGAYRCRFGAAIAANLQTIAADVSNAWTNPNGFAAQWANPGPDNALFRTDQEALSELVDILVQGLEMIRDVRLNGFLGHWPEEDKPKQAIYWRSQATVPSLAANVDGLRKLFEASQIGKSLKTGDGHIAQSIGIVLGNSVKAAADLGDPAPTEALKDKAQRDQLDHFRLTTSTLSELIGVRLTGALGLSAGFSSLDGD